VANCLTILSVDLECGLVHFDLCCAPIENMLDVDGEETADPTMACYVIAKVPDEFPVPGGQWINVTVSMFPERPTRH
jgi:hypothetical protein